jgi:hypothetical protein
LVTSDPPKMQRFYFDVHNSEGIETDTEGQLFPSRERARIEAIRILHDIVHDEMIDAELVKFTVTVRSEGTSQIFEASLILISGWSECG